MVVVRVVAGKGTAGVGLTRRRAEGEAPVPLVAVALGVRLVEDAVLPLAPR